MNSKIGHLELSHIGMDFPTPNGPFCALENVDLHVGEEKGKEILASREHIQENDKIHSLQANTSAWLLEATTIVPSSDTSMA